jgi:hypothetical protein
VSTFHFSKLPYRFVYRDAKLTQLTVTLPADESKKLYYADYCYSCPPSLLFVYLLSCPGVLREHC